MIIPNLVVWDPNPFNPYGAEVARSVSSGTRRTIRVGRSNMSYPWPNVTEVLLLPEPAQGQRTAWRALRYAMAVVKGILQFCRPGKTVVLVAWTNSSLERLMFILLTLVGAKIMLVDHNPVRGRDQGHWWSLTRLLRLRAERLIVHNDSLRESLADIEPSVARRIRVAPHPLYVAWELHHAGRACTSGAMSNRVVFAGSARANKGVNQLDELANHLSPDLTLELAVGILPQPLLSALSNNDNIAILGDGRSYLPDDSLYESMSTARTLIAPYTEVTASGTVMMALTLGTPVVAYRSSNLDNLPGAVQQVDNGNAQEMAFACRRVQTHPWTEARNDLKEYDKFACSAWQAISIE